MCPRHPRRCVVICTKMVALRKQAVHMLPQRSTCLTNAMHMFQGFVVHEIATHKSHDGCFRQTRQPPMTILNISRQIPTSPPPPPQKRWRHI